MNCAKCGHPKYSHFGLDGKSHCRDLVEYTKNGFRSCGCKCWTK